MVPIRDLFESHLTVRDLGRSMAFFGDVLGLELAHLVPERRVAFYWMVAEERPCSACGKQAPDLSE